MPVTACSLWETNTTLKCSLKASLYLLHLSSKIENLLLLAVRFSESAFLLQRQTLSHKPSALIKFIGQLSVNIRTLLTIIIADTSRKVSHSNSQCSFLSPFFYCASYRMTEYHFWSCDTNLATHSILTQIKGQKSHNDPDTNSLHRNTLTLSNNQKNIGK